MSELHAASITELFKKIENKKESHITDFKTAKAEKFIQVKAVDKFCNQNIDF